MYGCSVGDKKGRAKTHRLPISVESVFLEMWGASERLPRLSRRSRRLLKAYEGDCNRRFGYLIYAAGTQKGGAWARQGETEKKKRTELGRE